MTITMLLHNTLAAARLIVAGTNNESLAG
jgi:hypothetical protein